MRIISCLLALSLAAPALAVPMQLQHTGRLFDTTGLPLSNPHDVDVALYTSPTSGSALWSETLTSVDFDNGYFAIELGGDELSNPLDDAIFDNDVLWISLGLDGAGEIGSRLQLRSVPFARRAGTATNLKGGTVDASEISIAGNVVIDSSGGLMATGTLGGLTGCSTDDVPTFDGSSWSCSAPGVDTLSALSCIEGEVASWSASGNVWRCVTPYADADATNAMGTIFDLNPLNHNRYTDSEATAAMGAIGPNNPLNHDRYADADATDAMGAIGPNNPLNHDRYADADATDAMGAIGPNNPLNHNRYADADATAAMGAIGPNNPLNHDRFTNAEAIAAVAPRRVVFHRSMSGPWLAANAVIPVRSPTLTNSRLDFPAGVTYDKLFEVPLVPAGSLDPTKAYTVRMVFDVEFFGNDNDPFLALSDGTDVVGFMRADNANNVFGWWNEALDGAQLSSVANIDDQAPPDPGPTQRWVEVIIKLDATTTGYAHCHCNLRPTQGTASRVIDRDAALSLVTFANDGPETYGFYNVEVTITEND